MDGVKVRCPAIERIRNEMPAGTIYVDRRVFPNLFHFRTSTRPDSAQRPNPHLQQLETVSIEGIDILQSDCASLQELSTSKAMAASSTRLSAILLVGCNGSPGLVTRVFLGGLSARTSPCVNGNHS